MIHVNGNSANFGGAITNQGTFQDTNTTVTFAGAYTEKGTFVTKWQPVFQQPAGGGRGALKASQTSRWFFIQDLEILSPRRSE
jgi:hypothetical protein